MPDAKRQWFEWSREAAEQTGRCHGQIPSMGLPTDQVTTLEFSQSILSLRAHDVRSCSCWGAGFKPKKTANLTPPPALKGDAMLAHVEGVVRNRVVLMKERLMELVGKISVDNFKLDAQGRVTWDHILPPTLMTLSHKLPEFLTPQPDAKQVKPEGSVPFVTAHPLIKPYPKDGPSLK